MALGTKGHVSGPETWRIFCAIDLPAGVRASLMSRIKSLREAVPNAQPSWSREENIHLTMKFLGEIQTSRITDLSKAATQAAGYFSPFQVTVEDTGVFTKRGVPRVLWIGVKDKSGKLLKFHALLEERCAQEGFTREERPFHPHLTIARLRNPQGAATVALAHKEMPFEPLDVLITELLVIRSEPGGTGSKYTVISRHRLEG
jgi:2'-5' RNA ligase